jgi:tRNA pseudouridine55 synthase
LDPAATGLLLIAIGEGTKLVAHLTGHDKKYLAEITWGRSTSTLDGEGDTVAEAPIPPFLREELALLSDGVEREGLPAPPVPPPRLAGALQAEIARAEQIPPVYSAIKIAGRPAHERARRGEQVELAARAVSLRAFRIISASPATLGLELTVSKGYFVRALARDLGLSLGVPAHLSSLRRVSSGPFHLDSALPIEAGAEPMRERIVPLARAAQLALPHAVLTDLGSQRAARGQPLDRHHFAGDGPPEAIAAWLSAEGRLIAIGEPDSSRGPFVVRRGFTTPQVTATEATSIPRA